MQTATLPATVSETVRADYRTADVFRKWGLNYCCGGQLSLAEACARKGIDPAAVEADLAAATKTVSLPNALRFDEWPLPFLLDYIVHVHHGYLRTALPALQTQVAGFVQGHLKRYPYLADVEETFASLALQLTAAMDVEEAQVFPYLRRLSAAEGAKDSYGALFVRTMRPTENGKADEARQRTGFLLQQLRRQTDGYRFSDDACTNHQVIYHKLRELDADLVQHLHLENNLLFPKTREVEERLLQR